MEESGRKEPFRYVMNQPLACYLGVPAGEAAPGSGKWTEGVLLDLSPSGCKVRTSLNLKFTSGITRVLVQFQLNEQMLQFNASARWGWMFGIGQYQYGLRLDLSEMEDALLKSELEQWTNGGRAEGL